MRAAQSLSKPLRGRRSGRWQGRDDFCARVCLELDRSQAFKPRQSEMIKLKNKSHTQKAVQCIQQLVRPGAIICRGKPGASDGRGAHTNYFVHFCNLRPTGKLSVAMVDIRRGPFDCNAIVGLRCLPCQGNEPISSQPACTARLLAPGACLPCSKQRKPRGTQATSVSAAVCTLRYPMHHEFSN